MKFQPNISFGNLSRYPDDITQIRFVVTLLFSIAFSWFALLMKKNSKLLYNLDAFIKAFLAIFGDSDQKRVVETKIQNLQQGMHLATIYAAKFQQLACNLEYNNKTLINQLYYYLKKNVKYLLLIMLRIDA